MAEKRVKIAGVRKFIGEKLLKSVNTIPQIWGTIKIDMTAFQSVLERFRQNGTKVSSTSLFVKALTIALKENLELNSRLEKEEIVYYDNISPGVAVNTPNGLLVVTLKNVQDKSLLEIEADFKVLIEKIKTNKLTMDDTTEGTITVSNLSKEKLHAFGSIINNEECILLGLAGIQKEAIVLPDGTIAARDMATLTINMNHTIVDGVVVARFMGRMQELLQCPEDFLLNSHERGTLK